MSKEKWEIRYPLQLLLMLLSATTVQMQESACGTLASESTRCEGNGSFIQEFDPQGDCISSICFATNEIFRKEILSVPQLRPVLVRSGDFPMQVEMPFNMTCYAWAYRSKGLKAVIIESSKEPVLPDPTLRRKFFFLDGTSIIKVAVMTMVPLELTEDRHKQAVICSMTFNASGQAVPSERNHTAQDILYAFKQTEPYIRGPQEVEVGVTNTWDCVTDTVTVDRESQFHLDLTFNPVPHLPPEEDSKSESLGSSIPPMFKVTHSIGFTVPPSFRPAFFVECKAVNEALGLNKTVTMTAKMLRVEVVIKPLDLSSIFTVVGVSFGLGGVALGTALVVYYWRKNTATTAPNQG